MRRITFAIALALTLVASLPGPVGATTANISPASQSHGHNVISSWNLSWSGRLDYHVKFEYGQYGATLENLDTTDTSRFTQWGFSPCPGDPTNYNQVLSVWDNVGHSPGNKATDTSTAHEDAGNPC